MRKVAQKGFTIVELMIATAVFSTILLVILTAITQIGRMYYKGLTTSQTQEAARSVLDRVSQEIQFSGTSSSPIFGASTANPTVKAMCIGSSRFFYVINKQSASNSHALWSDTLSGCTASTISAMADSVQMNTAQPTPVANKGAELLATGMRVVNLNAISTSADLWNVQVKIVFGDDDLIEAIDASGNNVSQVNNPGLTTCKGSQIGTQFCAISELSTTVLKRVP